ncbi:signal peptidase I [Cryobacterium sp. Hb1]|uniref:signal peptidase I n=1 Tax=Cryobacterium sp. Hb1 TaxID=1259147 RepID=UPI0010699D5E|nr:signal peptidase I [Cryobacterium sp. Hb1]TFD65087.1 signal peptidase I [Cryobacterium sp. Hb1]
MKPAAVSVNLPADRHPLPKPVKQAAGLWRQISFALSLAVFLLVIGLAAVLIVVPKVTGSIPLTVLTSSMEPGFPPGTLIIVRPVAVEDVALGDVITYQMETGKPGVVTHRVIAINMTANERTFVTKGDNNGAADASAVLEGQIQGRLWYSVPLIGYVNNAVNGANRAWLIPVAASLLFAYAGYTIVAGVVGSVRKRHRAGQSGGATRDSAAADSGVDADERS